MKLKSLILSSIFLSLLFLACSKTNDKKSSSLPDTPAAKATYDNSNYGIYKGVFVGSSGTIIVNINNDNTVSATLKIDGVTYDFTSSQSIQMNQPSSVTFINGANSFTFSVAANGSNPTISNLDISGHPASAIAVLKESSSVLVKVFEGTYKENAAGGELGAWNLAIKGNEVIGIAHDNQQLYNYSIKGTVTNNQLNATSPDPLLVPQGSTTGTTLSGTISGDNISGTFSNAYGGGTWTGKRTL